MTAPDTKRRVHAWVLWLPGLLVALGAAAATAHGLYEVTVAAQVPPAIAWLYPVITDGLALVAYGATIQLAGSARRYAWFVVVLAAGVSGLAQAAYLAEGVHTAPLLLRFGIGAWPAVAAAIVAHLLFLIGHAHRPAGNAVSSEDAEPETGAEAPPPVPESDAVASVAVASTPALAAVADDERPTVQLPAVDADPVQFAAGVQSEPVQPERRTTPGAAESSEGVRPRPVVRPVAGGSQRERAHAAAVQFADEHRVLPTVSRLVELAGVSRGTAGEVLKTLRESRTELHLVSETTPKEAHS